MEGVDDVEGNVLAAGLKLTAQSLRLAHPGKNDEQLKRDLLFKCGYRFDRRHDFWTKAGATPIAFDHKLEAVIYFLTEKGTEEGATCQTA